MSSDIYQEAILRTPALQKGHVRLSSGLHSDVKVNMELLSGYAQEFSVVMAGIRQALEGRELRVFAAADRGARILMRDALYAPDFYPIGNKKVEKVEPRQFTIDSASVRLVQTTNELAIIDDVITTGGTPAALARAIHKINPDARLHLFGIWRRSELDPEFTKLFATQEYLVEEPIRSWCAEDCKNCPLAA